METKINGTRYVEVDVDDIGRPVWQATDVQTGPDDYVAAPDGYEGPCRIWIDAPWSSQPSDLPARGWLPRPDGVDPDDDVYDTCDAAEEAADAELTRIGGDQCSYTIVAAA